MPWNELWPIVVTLAGAGLLVLIAELVYRTIRKIIRHLGRRAEGRLAQARSAQTGDGAQPSAAEGAKSKPPKGHLAAFYRHAEQLVERLYRPFQMLAALLGAQAFADPIDNEVLNEVEGAIWDGVALAAIWIGLVAGLWLIALIGGTSAFGSDIGRRFRSQVETMTRVLSLLVLVAIVVIILVQLDQVLVLGSAVVAMVGVVAAVGALAAQTFTSNMLAGIALGLSDKLNIGDMVEYQRESGTVIARTLTYVALKLSDQRTQVIPTSQFLSNAHREWKITKKHVVGWVPLHVDWGVSIPDLLDALRAGYQRYGYGDGNDLRVEVIGVTESAVQVRAMVKATPDDLWTVQCDIREHLVGWINSQGDPRPRLRADITRRTLSTRSTPSTRSTSSTRSAPSTRGNSSTRAGSSTRARSSTRATASAASNEALQPPNYPAPAPPSNTSQSPPDPTNGLVPQQPAPAPVDPQGNDDT